VFFYAWSLIMELIRLIYRALSDGLTEEELSASIGVSTETIKRILEGEVPKDSETWERIASYFHMDLDSLRFGQSPSVAASEQLLSHHPVTAAVRYRKVPLLSWSKVGQLTRGSGGPVETPSHTLIETDVSGPRVFALRVKNNAMEPLFHKGEIIFVNPDLPTANNHYVVVLDRKDTTEEARLRQLKKLGKQVWLRALNPKYADCPLTTQQQIVGRVVRLRMNL
jgi:SOS-response transcriptional repressor LexA